MCASQRSLTQQGKVRTPASEVLCRVHQPATARSRYTVRTVAPPMMASRGRSSSARMLQNRSNFSLRPCVGIHEDALELAQARGQIYKPPCGRREC